MHKRTLRGSLGATAIVTGLLAGLPAMAAAQAAPTLPAAITTVPCNPTTLVSDISGAGSGDTLLLASNCIYTLTAANNTTDGRNGLPVINKTLTLVGSNTTITRSSAGSTPSFRIFEVANSPTASLTLRGITVSNGKASGFLGGAAANGGCILARFSGTPTSSTPTTLVLHDSSVEGCATGFLGSGGGIYLDSDTTARITHSSLSDNSAVVSGGGLYVHSGASAIIFGSKLTVNHALVGGGGVFVDSGASAGIAASVLTDNTTLGLGGGVHVAGTVDLTATQLLDNSAVLAGGGIYVDSGGLVRVHNGLLTDNTAAAGGGAYVNGSSRSAGGGVLRATASSMHNNAALNGGGVYVDSDGLAVIDQSFLNHNSAGLLVSSAPNSAAINAKAPKAGAASAATILPGHGGFLYNDGNARLTQDTLVGNHALLTGGAIYTNGRLLLGASTVQTNRALISGGAVYADSDASTHFAAVQFQLNVALLSGGAIFNDGHAFLQSSFVEGNIAPLGGGIYEARPFGMAVFNSLIFGNTLNNCRPINSVPLCAN